VPPPPETPGFRLRDTLDGRPIRVLVIDDDPFRRRALTGLLGHDLDVDVVATPLSGVSPLRNLARFRPDVVTLDVGMAAMESLDALKEMLALSDAPVIVVGARTPRDTALATSALALGAVDVVAKPEDADPSGIEGVGLELLGKIRLVAGRRWRRPVVPPPLSSRKTFPQTQARCIVAILAGTGGASALCHLLPRLPPDLQAALLVFLDLPEGGFAQALSHRLNQAASVDVREARDGEVLRHGRVLIAPGGRCLMVKSMRGTPIAAVCRPLPKPSPADALCESLSAEFGARAIGVVLTGAGEDGVGGLQALHRALGHTVAQDEDSSVVFGRARAAILSGIVDEVLPLEAISDGIVTEVNRQARRQAQLLRSTYSNASRGV